MNKDTSKFATQRHEDLQVRPVDSRDKVAMQNEFRKFISTIDWSYHISISRQYNMREQYRSKEHYINIFRQIEFNLNKRFLSSHWKRWDMDRRFYFIGFTHGSAELKDKHYHFLLHVPKEVQRKEFMLQGLPSEIKMNFLMKNYERFETKMHNAMLDHLEKVDNELLNIKRINDVFHQDEVMKYHTKGKMKQQMFIDDDCNDYFFVS